MKKRTIKRVMFGVIISTIIIIIFSETYTGRYIRWFLPDVYDLKKFPYEMVENGDSKLILPKKENNTVCNIQFELKGEKFDLNKLVENTNTNALLILHNDTIIYEKYTLGNSEETLFKLFSATKSVLSALIGIAVDEGKIRSIEEPIKNYVTGFNDTNSENLTIKQCLMETTGIEYNTSYLPWGGKPQTYYRPDIRSFTKNTIKVDTDKQDICNNSEHNINILGMLLERATNEKIFDYLSEKIWKPAGMNYPASFSIDSKRNQYAYVTHGLNATAIDFMIFGKMYLHNGNINGRQILSEKWIKESSSFEMGVKTEDYNKNFNSLWWIMRSGGYFANGHFGQRLFISPETNTVILRLGEKSGGVSWEYEVFPKIVEELKH